VERISAGNRVTPTLTARSMNRCVEEEPQDDAGQDRASYDMTGHTSTAILATTAATDRRARTAVRTDEHISRYDVLREDLGSLNRTHAEPCEIVLSFFVHSYRKRKREWLFR
jgi:hypothetical protein